MRFDYALEGYWLSRRRDFSPHTIADYELTFRRFIKFVGEDREVEKITSANINDFFNYLTEEWGLSKKTILNAWTALSSFWTWAERELGVQHVIRGKIAMPAWRRPSIVPYTKEEVRLLLEACDQGAPWDCKHKKCIKSKRPTALRDRVIMLLMVDSGIRVSELTALKVGDYDRKRGQLVIQHGKGDKKRVIYVGETARQAIWRYLATRGSLLPGDPLFATGDGRPMDRFSIQKMIHRAGQRAGVKNAYPHRFRHTFAINFLRNGGNLLALQDLLGHERLDTVKIYARLAEVDLEQAQKNASPADNWRL